MDKTIDGTLQMHDLSASVTQVPGGNGDQDLRWRQHADHVLVESTNMDPGLPQAGQARLGNTNADHECN